MRFLSLSPQRLRERIAVGLCCLFTAGAVSAESLTGLVRDANNQSFLVGARVSVDGTGRAATTDREGRFTMRDLAPGTYTVTVDYLGYDTVSQTVVVPNGADAAVDFSVGGEVLEMAAFVVEGNREGQAKALQQKRVSANLVDLIAADNIGKLPDGNAAEAVRRLPGVVAEIDQGEGRFIVVRGIDSALNNVTINGQVVGSPDGGTRAVAMDAVPADLISRIEVIKAVTPDMDHNAIGASVNIVTPSAFDRDEAFASAKFSTGINAKSDRASYDGAVSYGSRLADERWGIVVGASYSYRRYASDLASVGAWVDRNGYYVPSGYTLFDYDVERQRGGVNAGVEFRPTDGRSFYLRSSFNTFQDDEGRNQVDYDFNRGTLSNQTANTGEWSQGRASREFRSYLQRARINSVQAGTELEFDRSTFDASVTVGRSERITPRRVDWEFRSSSSAFPSSYDTSTHPIPTLTPSDNFYEASAYPFRRVRRRSDAEVEDLVSAELNFKREAELLGGHGSWKVGARWLSRDKSLDRNNENYTGATSFSLSEPGLAGGEPDDFMDGQVQFGATLDNPALEAFFANNPSYFEYDPDGSLANSTESDFDVSEDVMAAYAMADVSWGQLTVLGGVRLEATEADYAANEFGEENGSPIFRPITGSNDYTDVMPGLHLRYAFSDRLQLRASWTNTIGRPAYGDLAPVRETEVEQVTANEFQGSISTGNPDLKPYESMNFDAGLEYFLDGAGILSAAVFHKEIDNPIYGNSTSLFDTTFEGRFYSQLGLSRPENGDSGKVTGIELNYQQYFTFLPGPFNGFGFSANYTWTDSEVTIFSRPGEKLPFFKQADGAGNVALYYEKYGWDVRLALNYSGEYLSGVGGAADQDFYVDSRLSWDFKMSYRINDHWQVYGEMLNIFEEPLRESWGTQHFLAGREIYSWNAKLGVTWRM
ncbi:TonB-dependent receptor [Actomonas aquatica]|uniref:TonB-dependent receptor n=1 Tax=Actomonas aquatica TaxID=2866162 RepID=A0ABZ1C3U0_9BACT|nr:TonB-dependent receptor [Opitutus sp. WL0086]WRQ86275.1 TonB-dependent receptor [Opitutus sp. WL0086]